MLICLEQVLDPARLSAIVELLDDPDLFESGARTAGAGAKRAKDNLQGKDAIPEVAGVTEKIRRCLSEHRMFRTAAVPARVGRVLISRYEAGMAYGRHFDEPFIDDLRTDLSFTLFLSDPDSYEGGELEIDSAAGSQSIKLPAGSAVLYPSDRLHAVLPVTSGVRLAAVGWVQSRIRSADARELLFELVNATAAIEQSGSATEEALTSLKHVRNNLLRMWAEG